MDRAVRRRQVLTDEQKARNSYRISALSMYATFIDRCNEMGIEPNERSIDALCQAHRVDAAAKLMSALRDRDERREHGPNL